ncbi:MAG: hypothetical protein IIA45_13285 [Bacteroidetes bacterium]|nr:hypothetical protein [Bacteroidota bacterium]
MDPNFEWSSTLGISAALFIISGVFYLMVGIMMPIFQSIGTIKATKQLYLGRKTDTLMLGKSPEEFERENPWMVKYVEIAMLPIAGLSVGMGIMEIMLAYFGIRSGLEWAFWTCAIANLVTILMFWSLVIIPVMVKYKISWWVRSSFTLMRSFARSSIHLRWVLVGWRLEGETV